MLCLHKLCTKTPRWQVNDQITSKPHLPRIVAICQVMFRFVTFDDRFSGHNRQFAAILYKIGQFFTFSDKSGLQAASPAKHKNSPRRCLPAYAARLGAIRAATLTPHFKKRRNLERYRTGQKGCVNTKAFPNDNDAETWHLARPRYVQNQARHSEGGNLRTDNKALG